MNENEKLPEEVMPSVTEVEDPKEESVDVAVETPATADESHVNYHNMTCAELLAELDRIVASGNMQAHREVAALKTAFYSRRNREQLEELSAYVAEGNAPETFAAQTSAEEVPFRDLLAKFKEGRAIFLEEEEKRMQQNLEKKQVIIDELRKITEDIDNVNLNFPRFQQLQQDFREKADLPPTAETAIWKNYQSLVEEFYDKLKINKELRDLDFRKNLEAKRQIIEEARALVDKEDVVEAARQLQSLHNSWREIGPVAKDIRAEIWEEFKTLSSTVNKRHQEFFESRKASEAEAEIAKTALCNEVEAIKTDELKNFSDWDEATKKILDMQARWKGIGFASRKTNNALFNRFRTACDAFFTAKAEFYAKSRDEMGANFQKKVELCEKAEALASEENLKKAAEAAVALQAEWKTIGNSGRRQSDEIWKRFSTACNAVFDRRHKFIGERRQEENANLKAKTALIDRLKELDREADPRENLQVVKECQAKWQEIGHVPAKVKETLWQEFRGLCDVFYAADRDRQRENRENRFKNRVREMRADNPQKVGGERERLMRELDRKRAELKTYENNMGFFSVKSSAGNSMLKEMERRSERIRQDIADIENKLRMIE